MTATQTPTHNWNAYYRRLRVRDAITRWSWAVGTALVVAAVTGWWWGWSLWLLCGIVAGLLVAWLTPASAELGNARVERRTVKLLDQLAQQADLTVLHNRYAFGIRVPIRHVVVSSAGVFLIESRQQRLQQATNTDSSAEKPKDKPRKFLLRRERPGPVALQATRVAASLRKELEQHITVCPVIVVHGPAAYQSTTHENGTIVITADMLRGLLTQATPEIVACNVTEVGKALNTVLHNEHP